jgi:hypothetical protein
VLLEAKETSQFFGLSLSTLATLRLGVRFLTATVVGDRIGVTYRQVGKPKKISRQDAEKTEESHAKTPRRKD